MGAIRFATTQLRGLHPVGPAADLQHGLIAALLERHLGSDYAEFFSEFEVQSSDTRDWYVDAPPMPVPVTCLPEEEQAALRARCNEMIAQVRALADAIEKQGSQGRNIARVLRDATVFPPEDVWARNGKPVVINWGYQRGDAGSSTGSPISEMVKLKDPQPRKHLKSAPDVVTAISDEAAPRALNKRQWRLAAFLWLIFAGLVGALYALLLPACAIWLPGNLRAFGYCPAAAALDPALEEGLRLRREVDQAEFDLARHQQDCATEAKRNDG